MQNSHNMWDGDLMFRDGMRKYVKAKDKRGWNRSEYNKRLIQLCKQTFEDLKLVCDHMDEKVQSQIFTSENLMPFFKALFHVHRQLTDEERKRLLKIARDLIILLTANAHKLAPNAWKFYQTLKASEIEKLSLIYAEGMPL